MTWQEIAKLMDDQIAIMKAIIADLNQLSTQIELANQELQEQLEFERQMKGVF